MNQGHEPNDSSGAGSSFNLHYRLEFSFGGKSWSLTILSANIQHIVNANKWTITRPVVRCMTLDHFDWPPWFHHYWPSFELLIWRSFPRIDPCISVVICDGIYTLFSDHKKYTPIQMRLWCFIGMLRIGQLVLKAKTKGFLLLNLRITSGEKCPPEVAQAFLQVTFDSITDRLTCITTK